MLAHIERQNPNVAAPRYAWQFNPFEVGDGPEVPEDFAEYDAERKAKLQRDG